jgi:hypothetical protein
MDRQAMTQPTARVCPFEDWFLSHGFIRDDVAGYVRYGIAWSTRCGYDFTDLEFQSDPQSTHPDEWYAIVGHHQSGENPRMTIGVCRNINEIYQVYEAIKRINGYEK